MIVGVSMVPPATRPSGVGRFGAASKIDRTLACFGFCQRQVERDRLHNLITDRMHRTE